MSLKRINKGKPETKAIADDRYFVVGVAVAVAVVIVVSRRRL